MTGNTRHRDTVTNATSYRFKVGHLACIAISDGNVSYPLGSVFANVPAAQIEEALARRDLPVDFVTVPCSLLYARAGKHRVLVDLGAGALWPSAGRLVQNMRAAGVEPAEIDAVILTHAHPGHVGGAFDREGKLVYANARYYVSKDEWEFWTSEVAYAKAPERHVAIARQNLEPIRDRMHLIDHEQEIVPGIGLIPAPGHTPGHLAVSVSSGGECLLYISDAAFHPLHLEQVDWTPIYDILPGQAIASKCRILDRAAQSKALVMGHHLAPFPSLGYVSKSGRGWQWQSVDCAIG